VSGTVSGQNPSNRNGSCHLLLSTCCYPSCCYPHLLLSLLLSTCCYPPAQCSISGATGWRRRIAHGTRDSSVVLAGYDAGSPWQNGAYDAYSLIDSTAHKLLFPARRYIRHLCSIWRRHGKSLRRVRGRDSARYRSYAACFRVLLSRFRDPNLLVRRCLRVALWLLFSV
jgi:hypothetical protein